MTRPSRQSGALALALLLAACTGTRDPSEAGFFDGIRNIATGTYEQDAGVMRKQAETAEARVADLRRQDRQLQEQIATLEGEEKRLRQRQRVINAQLEAQQKTLEQMRRRRGAVQSDLDALEARVAELAAEQSRLAATPVERVDPAEVARLERENEALRQDIDAMLALMPR